MSRSKYNRKFHDKGGFINFISYFSNKKDKRITNRTFRRTNKVRLKQDKPLVHSIREIRDVWCFDSDGLKFYESYTHRAYDGKPYTKEDIRLANQK